MKRRLGIFGSYFLAYAVFSLLVTVTLALVWLVLDGNRADVVSTTTTTFCAEDMACWDPCSMGNLHSGPDGPCPEKVTP